MPRNRLPVVAVRSLAWLLLPALAGCLSAPPPVPEHWTIEFARPESAEAPAPAELAFGAVRVVSVDVRAPYNGQRLVVLRPDGSVAFDAFNGFAAPPAALLKGAAVDVIESTGVFSRVLSSSSSASGAYAVELTVTRLALDCRTPGSRAAVVALKATLLNGRDVVGVSPGEAAVPVEDGNFSQAFSRAFTAALAEAAAKFRR